MAAVRRLSKSARKENKAIRQRAGVEGRDREREEDGEMAAPIGIRCRRDGSPSF